MKIHDTIVKTRSFGDFDIHFQYVNEEPALVIKAHRFLSVRKRAYVIMQEAAWKYVDNVESPASGHSKYMVHASAQIQEMLGLGSDVSTRYRIAEGIMDCLDDLINLKPMKVERPAGLHVEGTLTIGDQKIDVSEDADDSVINSSDGYTPVDTPYELVRRDL